MKRSKLKNKYILHAAVSSDTSIAQYRALVLDYAFNCVTYKFIRDEKESCNL